MSSRVFHRLPEQVTRDCSDTENVQTSTPGVVRKQQAAHQEPGQERLAGSVLLALLQEARSARQAAIVHRGGSGRQATARPLDVEFHRVPPPPTPYCPTPEVAMEVASLPRTPGTALRASAAQSDVRSTLSRRSRSASFDTPMEGVLERHGFVLQPKTPALAFTPMEGVLERLGPMLPATCARRRLHTTTPGPSRARSSAAADGRLFTPGDAAVLASGGDPDHDSPVEGLLQQNTAAGAQAAQASAAPGGGSSSGSFAFSRAAGGIPAAPQQLGGRMEQAGGDPLGFFAADGGKALHRRQGIDSLDGAPPTSPWHLRDYNPSPQVQFPQPATPASLHSAPKRSSLGQSVVACSLQPSPAAEPNLGMDYDDDDDDGFGGGGADWDLGEPSEMDHMSGAEGPEEDAEMEEAGSDEHTPAPEEEAEASEQAGDAAAGPSRVHDRIPVSCNKRLKREFRARKSLAGVGLQPDAGRRRSTRVSCKPLEWWRNERKVYERKFHSLPTVDHLEVYSTTPTWTFVSDYKEKKTKARTK
ncbi:hypothetical protein COCSUDRAFT_55347 [Coccomyxa subellipsoidea C-169]|uniref:Uncharacterized protein n=1 Tax=Coccomyxa subellipsoidea (strain C-169) TaxID=574566 RepID=I0Z9L4_COCSC|nr:hypothetical protein COCSUDRAFT_55347 [Coccomyxa subellipsoidea C-169]EIE27333.1 hypothetical protein COCSUDRAFT_55347 [Coccomyxa subellipsoidea C-169]|eukprot:XP_005651877.1 hypothetical protein COCSUDRAFT_55347 [Coccomyxa subellipsoidea C-169]